MVALVIIVIFIALVFDFLNGFHDSANSIATVVSTRAMTPRKAVMWAAIWLLPSFSMFTLQEHWGGTCRSSRRYGICHYVRVARRDCMEYYHLVFRFADQFIACADGRLCWSGNCESRCRLDFIFRLDENDHFHFVAPLMGMVMGFGLMVILMWIFHKYPSAKVNRIFRKLQLLSAALYSSGHGTNDAQKTMGMITGLLVTAGVLHKFEVPYYVILMSDAAIALGTLFGGWRIVKTMGQKITKLKPSGGFCAETAGGVTLFITAGREYRSARHTQLPVRSWVSVRRNGCPECGGELPENISNTEWLRKKKKKPPTNC